MRSMSWQLGILGTISAFAFRHRETKKSGNLDFLELLGPSGPVTGLLFLPRTSGCSLGTFEKTTLFQKPKSFGQDSTSTFKLFSKGLIKHRVKFIRTFAYIEVKLMAHQPGHGAG